MQRFWSERFWAWLGAKVDSHRGDVPSHDPAPSLAPTTAPLAPTTTPAVRQEQFAEVKAEERMNTLYRSVVATNNRNVTRDCGSHVVDETRPLREDYRDAANMTPADERELAELGYGVVYTDGERKKMVEKDRRRYDAAPLGHALLWTKD